MLALSLPLQTSPTAGRHKTEAAQEGLVGEEMDSRLPLAPRTL